MCPGNVVFHDVVRHQGPHWLYLIPVASASGSHTRGHDALRLHDNRNRVGNGWRGSEGGWSNGYILWINFRLIRPACASLMTVATKMINSYALVGLWCVPNFEDCTLLKDYYPFFVAQIWTSIYRYPYGRFIWSLEGWAKTEENLSTFVCRVSVMNPTVYQQEYNRFRL